MFSLVIYFLGAQDLDSGASYDNFMANCDVRSFDGSSMFMALVNGSALNKTGLVAKTQTPLGLRKLAKSDGVDYASFLQPSDFAVVDEDALVALLEAWMQSARTVFLWGQVRLAITIIPAHPSRSR